MINLNLANIDMLNCMVDKFIKIKRRDLECISIIYWFNLFIHLFGHEFLKQI